MTKKRKKAASKHFGEVAVDLGKVLFATFVLGTILSADVNKSLILIIGSVLSMTFILGGIYLLTKNEEED